LITLLKKENKMIKKTDKKEPKYGCDYKRFKVTFLVKKKYFPLTRTVEVLALDRLGAEECVHNEFGSYKYDKKEHRKVFTNKQIEIKKVKEIKN
jgi:hypothetical protein